MGDELIIGYLTEELHSMQNKLDALTNIVNNHVTEQATMAAELKELITVWRSRKVIGVMFGGIVALTAGSVSGFNWLLEHVSFK